MQFYLNNLFCLEVGLSHPSQSGFLSCYFVSINTCINICTSSICADMSSCVKLSQWLFWVFFLTTISGIPCTNHTFKCRNNICIRKQYARCDGTVDCVDGSDESSCSKFLSNIHLSELWTFYTIKIFITSCFGLGTSHAGGTEFLLHSLCDIGVMISYQFASDLVAEFAKFLWEGGLPVMRSLRQLHCLLQQG